MVNSNAVFDRLHQHLQLGERHLNTRFRTNLPWRNASLLGFWELQGQLSTPIQVAIAALVSIWIGIAVAIVWGLIAAFVYHNLRKRGLPDLLDHCKPECGKKTIKFARWGAGEITKGWLAGIQASTSAPFLDNIIQTKGRLARRGVFAFTLVYFGITTNYHFLRKASVNEGAIYRLTSFGVLLNSPFRLLVGTKLIHLTIVGLSWLVGIPIAEIHVPFL